MAQGCISIRKEKQHSRECSSADNYDDHHHNHRQAIMIITDNGHEDGGTDNKEDGTSTQRLPSEDLRTKNSEFIPNISQKMPRKILQENRQQNPPKFVQQNSPTTFCRGAGPANDKHGFPQTLFNVLQKGEAKGDRSLTFFFGYHLVAFFAFSVTF